MELKLRSHPGASASGFTTVQIPVAPTAPSPAGAEQTYTLAPAAPSPPAAAAGPEADPTPVITGKHPPPVWVS